MNIGSIGTAAAHVPQVAHQQQAAPPQATPPARGSDADGDGDPSTATAAATAGTGQAVNLVA